MGSGDRGAVSSRSIPSQRKTKQKPLNSIPWLKTREGASTLNRVAVLERKQLGEGEAGLFSSAASRTEGEVFSLDIFTQKLGSSQSLFGWKTPIKNV